MPQPDHESRTRLASGDETEVDSPTSPNSPGTLKGIASLQGFKQLWHAGAPPDLPAYVAVSGPISDDVLAAIVRADLRYRWTAGKALPVEWYLERFERLSCFPDLAVDLIYAEYLQAEKHGQPRGEEEFFLRFPQHSKMLRDQFELHGAICHDHAAVETDRTDDVAGPMKAMRSFPHVPGYQILEEIGRGGIGVVYRAHDPRLNRIVALKLLLSGAHASAMQLRRFQTEAKAAARLQHRNIVQIHEVSEHEGRPYLVLEFVTGGNLGDRYRGQPQEPYWSAALVEQLALTVEFAHQQGIIHRDLKPANVLLEASREPVAVSMKNASSRSPTAPLPNAKITDFGLAKLSSVEPGAKSDDKTHTGDVLGTPSYMSPEQAAGHVNQIDVRTDVYALGAILYELLTGRPPFVGASAMETMRMVVESEPVHPSRLIRSMPTDLQTICLKCLEKGPSSRYASARALADDLQRFLEDRPILARRTGMVERGWRWARRNPLSAGLVMTVFCLLAVGLPTVTALFLRERTQAARAEENFHLASSAVEKYLTNIGDSGELKAHGLEALRRELLLTAKDFYEQLGERHGNDRGFRAELAQAHHRLAYISRELGDLESAVEQYSQMCEVMTGLVRDYPQEPKYLQMLGRSRSLLGHVYQEMGDSKAAELQMRQARAVIERLARSTAMTPSVRLDLAAIAIELRALYGTMDRHHEEKACFEEASRLCDELRADPPEIAEFGSQLANTYNKLAVAFMERGFFREAEFYYQAARDITEQLVRQFPDAPQRSADLAKDFFNLSVMYTRQGRNDEARAALDESAMLLDTLSKEHPLVLDYQHGAAGNWNNIGSLEFNVGHWDQAEIAWREAHRRFATLADQYPNVPGFSIGLAQSSSNLGNACFMRQRYSECEGYYAEAISVIESQIQSQPENVELRGFLVGVQGNLASAYHALEQDDKALELYESSLQVQRSIVDRLPNVPDHRRRLTAVLINLANVLHKSERYSDAEPVVLEGCAVANRLVDEHADVPDYRDVLGDALTLLGNILFDTSRLADAEDSYRKSLRVREALAHDYRDVAPYQLKLGEVQFLLGRVARDTNQPTQALDWFDQAIQQFDLEWQKLDQAVNDETTGIRNSLCGVHWEKARALYRLGRTTDALDACDLGLSFQTVKQADGLHALRARVLARLTKIEEALCEADSVIGSVDLSSFDLVDLAATYALVAASQSEDQNHRSRSIELLRKAESMSGFNADFVNSDPDFVGISGWTAGIGPEE